MGHSSGAGVGYQIGWGSQSSIVQHLGKLVWGSKLVATYQQGAISLASYLTFQRQFMLHFSYNKRVSNLIFRMETEAVILKKVQYMWDLKKHNTHVS